MTKIKQFAVFVILLSLLVSMVAGCQPKFQPGSYTDDTGRTVSIDEIPERIVSFGPSITEILFALGLGDKVVGVDDYSDYPEAAKAKARIGSAFTPSLEKIAELAPDLVLTVKHEKLNRELQNLGVSFMVLDPTDIDGILKNIKLMGKINGAGKRAEELVAQMEATISRVATRVKNAPKVRVFHLIDATDLNNPWTAGPGSFVDSLTNVAGGENIAGKAMSAWIQFSVEQVVSADPEVIILPAAQGKEAYIVGGVEALKEHPAWRSTTAVKEGRIYTVDADLISRPGPRIVQGLEEIAKIIHPELLK